MFLHSSITHVFNQHTDHLVTDDDDLCQMTLERGAAEKLATLVKSITPLESHPDWDQEEPESLCCLREVLFHLTHSLACLLILPRRR
jgi:hypothetical protein